MPKQKSKNKVEPNNFLTISQRKYFSRIKEQLEELGLLGSLDEFILNQTAIAIDRLNEVEKLINENPQYISDKQVQAVKERYSKEFYKGIEQLGMSPSARVKMGILTPQQKSAEKDPLLKALGE